MPRSVAILQSNYIPWKGYFDIVGRVDRFVFYDDRQYATADWRNRNRIISPNGIHWLTIPCGSSRSRLICEVEPSDSRWQRKHWNALRRSYGKSEFFSMYKGFFEDFYLNQSWTNLSELNQYLIRHIARDFLGFTTQFDDSRNYSLEGDKSERVLSLIRALGDIDEYVSGPAAKEYLDEQAFERAGITITWMDYHSYPEYRQQRNTFIHEVSVLDLLFREGPSARKFLNICKQ